MYSRGEYKRNKRKRTEHICDICVGIVIVSLIWLFFLWSVVKAVDKLPEIKSDVSDIATNSLPQAHEKESYTITAIVTGYNTVVGQTDDTPCLAASGDYICGRTDVVACPSTIELGTRISIDSKQYICLDRTHRKYADRFDISFDKDVAEAIRFGKQIKEVKIYD